MRNHFTILFLAVFGLSSLWYCIRFYPQQQMPVGVPVVVYTPEPELYHNDCLHPCIRYIQDDKFVMAYSPYYGWNNKIENPIVSLSNSIHNWNNGTVIDETPETGYNSDPCVYAADSTVYVFWRQCDTPLCQELGLEEVVIGGMLNDTVTEKRTSVFLSNRVSNGDITQCPILMRRNDKYLFYAVWYQYQRIRKNKGLAIWEGTSLDEPDFFLRDTLQFDNPLVCDKLFQKKIGSRIYYFPVPKRFDLWHFDLFEYDGKLWMVSCAEKDDNIMLSVSEDWRYFKTFKRPLINNHYSENYTGYRQYFYKPTAIVQNDSLFLFYTANSKEDPNQNVLYLSVESMRNLKL